MKRRIRLFAQILILLMLGMIGLGILGTASAAEQATTTEAVHFTKLVSFLPDAPSGWEGEEPEGMMYTIEEGAWSMATRSYSKLGEEDITAEAGIMDSAFSTVGWWAAWKGFYAWETTEGYAKTTNVKGFPAWEAYTKDTNDYTLYVGINDRFMVFIQTNSDKDTLYKFANAIDYDGIAALAPAPAVTGQPTPTTTEETHAEPPTEEGKTPGFEAGFALVGLLVVVYLVRRDK
jgi:PGF-CTERM protein